MENEIWKDIEGYKTYYQVSNIGRVKSLCRIVDSKRNNAVYLRNEKILVNKIKKSGYRFVSLCREGKVKYFHVHRLVAIAFIPNTKNNPEINHKDCDKSNNNVSNLEWVSRSENNSHAVRNGRRKSRIYIKGPQHNLSKMVVQYDLSGNFMQVWGSITQAAEALQCSHSGIGRVCNNRRGGKTFLGYKWEFYSNNPITASLISSSENESR